MKTKKKRKKRIGTSLIGTGLALLLAALLPAGAAAKKKPALENYALISGSVFQESGYALPDASATLVAEPPSAGASGKAQKMETVANARGEFIFHVPPGPMHYAIVVSAKGYQSLRKSVAVEGEERVEVTFQLERELK